MGIHKEFWHGLSIELVETRLNTPGSESGLVREAYRGSLDRLGQLNPLVNNCPIPVNGELYVRIGGGSLMETAEVVAENWGWELNDRSWIKTPIEGSLGRQRWCLSLSSREIGAGNRYWIGLWVPEPPNQGLYATHSLYPGQNSMGTELKIALLTNAIWIQLLKEYGRNNILTEWGVNVGNVQDRLPQAPLQDRIPFPKVVPTWELVAA